MNSQEVVARLRRLLELILFGCSFFIEVGGTNLTLTGTILLGYLLWVVTQLWHEFRWFSRRLPFAEENARRIRGVGAVVTSGEIGRATMVYLWSYCTCLHFN